MSIVKMNAITVPADSGDELARRFAARAGALDGVDGFLGFELLQPTDGRSTWLVVTRWRDEATYDAWVASADFAAGHGRGGDGEGRPRPVAVASEVWSFAVAGGSQGS
jgi:heme oxygenase (mycobilin-producing)